MGSMKDLESIVRALQSSGKAGELEQLAASRDGKKLSGMIDGAALEKAVRSGDGAALQRMLGTLLSTPEGKNLAADVQRIMGK